MNIAELSDAEVLDVSKTSHEPDRVYMAYLEIIKRFTARIGERERLVDFQSDGVKAISLERDRQVSGEKWYANHDAQHRLDELALAAAAYALPERWRKCSSPNGIGSPLWARIWPFDENWWKPSPENRIKELTKAGALIAAEIDRLKRQEARAALAQFEKGTK